MFGAIHDFFCDLPQVGPLFEDYPVIGYGILLLSIGAYVWFKFF